MSVNFWLCTDEQLKLQPGLPGTYSGNIIPGAIAEHVTSEFRQIILQEVSTDYVCFRKLSVNWKKPARIKCGYQCSPGMFTRTALDNPLHEYIKGAGEVHLNKEEFASLSGSNWESILLSEKAGDHIFIDMEWASGFSIVDDLGLVNAHLNAYFVYFSSFNL